MGRLFAVSRKVAEVAAEPVRWLWGGRIPLGKVTLLVGDPGVGKSLMVADWVARVTTNRLFPGDRWVGEDLKSEIGDLKGGTSDGETKARSDGAGIGDEENLRRTGEGKTPAGRPAPQRQTGEPAGSRHHIERQAGRPAPQPQMQVTGFPVVMVAPEDSIGDTLRPRLEAAGADLAKVFVFDQVGELARGRTDVAGPVPFRLPEHMESLRAEGKTRLWTAMMVLDPLHMLLGKGSLAETLRGLEEVAESSGVAVVVVCHLSKSRALRPLYRARGSIVLAGAARSVLLLEADPEERERRILVQLKSVLGERMPATAFRIFEGGRQAGTPAPLCMGPRIEWEEEGSQAQRNGGSEGEERCGDGQRGAGHYGRADEAVAEFANLTAEAHSAIYEACAWLRGALVDGPRAARELKAGAEAAGISYITLRRAKRLLRVRSEHDGSAWVWRKAG